MLAGKDFRKVINLTGGIRAWNGEKAYFNEEKGLELFSGNETTEDTLIIAYGLELGLEEFYVSMMEKAKIEQVRDLFKRLSQIEANHRNRIFHEYIRITNTGLTQKKFADEIVVPAAEGGMSTEEYIKFFGPASESPESIIEMAMSIEAQALDLYSRASDHAKQDESKKFLTQMAEEERTHLGHLGDLMDTILSERSLS